MDIQLVAMQMEAKELQGQPVPVVHRSSKPEKARHHDCDVAGKVSPCGPHHCGHCHSND